MDFDKIRREAGERFSIGRFLCSARVVRYLATRLHRISDQFGIPRSELAVIYNEKNQMTAATDNRRTVINAGHPLFGGSDAERLLSLLGVSLHEQGHRLFTNYTKSLQLFKELTEGKGFTTPPPNMTSDEKEAYEKLQELLEDRAKVKVFIPVVREYLNILEDGRIERMLLVYVKGMENCKDGLHLLRRRIRENGQDISAAEEMISSGTPAIVAMTGPILYFTRSGKIKGCDAEDPSPLGKRLLEIAPIIDAYMMADNTTAAHQSFVALMIRLEPEIQEFFEKIEEKASGGSGAGEGSSGSSGGDPSREESESSSGGSSGESSGADGSEEGGSADASGESETEEGSSEGSSISEMSEEELEEIVKEIEKALREADANPMSNPDPEEMKDSKGSDRAAVKDAIASLPDMSGSSGDPHSHAEAECPDIISLPTTEIFGNGSGEVSYGTISANPVEADLDRLRKSFIDEEAEAIADEALVSEYEDIRSKKDFGSAHKNVNMTIERLTDLDGLERILRVVEKKTLPISKVMARKSDFFEKDRESFMIKGLYTGTRFEASRAARPDYKHFSKKKGFDEPSSLAVSLVVDESGSMFGRKEEAARAFSLIMYDYIEFLRESNGIEIPLNIIGHTESGGRTNIFVYADSERPDKRDRLRLMDIKARANNRDGHAIRLALERLEQLDTNQKLLVIVTDGQPAATGYAGRAAEEDLRDIARHCERQGIALLVAAIDQDKEKIKRIYGAKHFLDIQDLSTLAARVIRVIQNELANN